MKYNFSVPSMFVQGTRSPFSDSDYASLGIATVAPDGTVLEMFDPITQNLGSVESGSVSLGMEVTDIDVPDGGSMAVVFTIMNKGTWSGHGSIIDALNAFVGGLVGALAGGQVAGKTNPTTTDPTTGEPQPPSAAAIGPWWAGILALAALSTLEIVKIAWADCDGWVVNATMSFGRVELDQTAGQATWNWTTHYHGSDSPTGCGSTSDYFVNYEVLASALPGILVPNVFGDSPADALHVLANAGLTGTIVGHTTGIVDEPEVTDQDPQAGLHVRSGTNVALRVVTPQSVGHGHELP